MCTSIISNRKKTIVGWNLDILDMEHRISESDAGVFIEILDPAEGWLPLFGANSRGDFVGMPTCWPFDSRSDPVGPGENVILLDIDLLTQEKTLAELKAIAETGPVFSVPGVTFMSSLSDRDGNVLQIIPGQGYRYFEKPIYQVMTNFSPFKMNSETHPWMGWARYQTAEQMLKQVSDDFDVPDCFEILKAVSQEVCPTVVSMVFDVTEMTVYWCENRQWDRIRKRSFARKTIAIRPAVPQDAASLLAIYAPYVKNTAVSFEYDVPTAEEFRGRILKTLAEYPYLVAEADGKPVGYAYAGPFQSRQAYRHSAEVSIYVAPAYHGMGIGRALYEKLETLLLRQNVFLLNACIAVTDRADDAYLTDASVQFHEKTGYRLTGQHRNSGYKFGRWYGMIWMEKQIAQLPEHPAPFLPFSQLNAADII